MMKKIFAVFTAIALFLNLAAQEKFKDARDGNTYKTITIAGMTWMAENLKYIAEGSGAFYFDNDPNNLNTYGVLYEWQTAVRACPDGWHLPSGADFRKLIDNSEIADTRGKKKAGPASPEFQLAGMKNYEGVFTEMDESGYYWTSTEYDQNEAEFFSYVILNGKSIVDISRKEDMPDIHGAEKTNKYSVRCVKNDK
ncbi:MAG: hypothetical protein MUF36_09735 [Bacteroidales bacterium]|nr:hypothetical protein [Bacteroidales bacterium]